MEQQINPLLTIILAVKDVNEIQFNTCLSSMANLKYSNRICLIVISSGKLPKITKIINDKFNYIKIINQKPEGVYSAYNRGLQEPLADYVLFLGVDDLVLPGLDDLITKIYSLGSPDLIAACSFMQRVGISKPSKLRGGLLFRNWCQQGLLYHSRVFKNNTFDTKYKMQADHKFNMELVSNQKTKISYHNDVITYFSYGGISSTTPDWIFRADMPDIVKSCYGRFYWLIALVKRYMATVIKNYPNQ